MPEPGELITDPELLKKIREQESAAAQKPAAGTPITDPALLKKIGAQERMGQWKDVAEQGTKGVGIGLGGNYLDVLTAPLHAIPKLWGGGGEGLDVAQELAKRAVSSKAPLLEQQDRSALMGEPAIKSPVPDLLSGIPDAQGPTLLTDYNVPEPQTTLGRYARKTGEVVGASLPFSGGVYRQAARGAAELPRVAPQFWPYTGSARMPAEDASAAMARKWFQPIAENPGKFATLEAGGMGGAAAAQQASQEADLPIPLQIGAGLAGGLVAPLSIAGGMRAAEGLMANQSGAMRLPRLWTEGGGGGPPRSRGGLSAREATAYQQLADDLTRANVPMSRVYATLDRYEEAIRGLHSSGRPPDQAVIADLAESLARHAGATRRAYTGASDIISGSIEARQRGYTDKPTAPGISRIGDEGPYTTPYTKEVYTEKGVDAGQHARLMEDEARGFRIYDEKFHGFGKDADATAEMIAGARDKEAAKLWGNVRMAGRNVDISQQAGPNAVIRRYTALAQQLPKDIQAKVMNGIQQYLRPDGQLHSDIIVMNKAKRSVGDRIADMIKPTSSNTDSEAARMLTRLNQEMVRALSNIRGTPNGPTFLGPLYARANSAFAGRSEELRHIKLGQQIYRGDVPVQAFDALRGDRDAQKLVKLGFHGETRRESAGKRTAQDRTLMFDSPDMKEKRAYLIERSETDVRGGPTRVRVTDPATGRVTLARPGFDRPEHFGELVEGERRMKATEQTALRGSQTAERQADDAAAQALDTLHGFMDAIKGSSGALSAAKRMAELAYTRLMGPGADVADLKANILFTGGASAESRAARRRHLQNIEMRMGSSRFARWAQLVGQAAAQGQRQQTGGIATGLRQEE